MNNLNNEIMNTKCHLCHGLGHPVDAVGENCKHCKGNGFENNSTIKTI